MPDTNRHSGLTGVAEIAIDVGRKRRQRLQELKAALQASDQKRALEIARELVGIKKQQPTDEAA